MSVSSHRSPSPAATGAPGDEAPRRRSAPRAAARARSRAAGAVGRRNLGLVIALVLLCVVGVATAGDRFASIDNALTILRLASVIGVISIGMTFVISGGGIDLSVGAMVALVLGLGHDGGHADHGRGVPLDHHGVRRARGRRRCGLVNGVLVAYGRLAPFIATLAMLAAARGLAEIIANRTQIVRAQDFIEFFRATSSACRC